MGELVDDYFDSANAYDQDHPANSKAYFYKISRLGLKDTLGVRRKMVNLFKTAYMDTDEKIDMTQWLALKKHGYCFTPSNAANNETTMAMDVISKDGFVRGVIVGSVPSCENARIDNEFAHKFPPPKKGAGAGGGC